MSEQDSEMQFADPEWRPPQQRGAAQEQGPEPSLPRPINAARIDAERRGSGTPIEPPPLQQEEGYRGPTSSTRVGTGPIVYSEPASQSQHSSGNQGRSQPRSARPWYRSVWLWIIVFLFLSGGGTGPFFWHPFFFLYPLLMVVFIVAIIAFFFNRQSTAAAPPVGATQIRRFSVSLHPTISLRDDIGTVRVHAGTESDQVIVQETRRSRGWLWLGNPQRTQVQYNQNNDGNVLTIKAQSGWSILAGNRIDFDVTVPRDADLKLKTDAGNIHVHGISGQMVLSSDAGSISAGQVLLRGQSKLKTDVGSVTFVGAVDPGGSYQFETDVGSVNVTLPTKASFYLDAKTDVGSFHSDFPISQTRNTPGSKASGSVGDAPSAKLVLRSDVGSIKLRRGQ